MFWAERRRNAKTPRQESVGGGYDPGARTRTVWLSLRGQW